mgnify:FL=1
MLLFPAGYFHFSKKAASDACGYPDSPTRLLREVPQAPFEHRFSICGCAFWRTLLTATSLPLDAALCAEISKSRDEVKRCVECGAVFTPKYNRAKYSPDCAARGRRKKEAERQRQRYLQATQLSS